MTKLVAAAFALLAVTAFTVPASAECSPGHTAKKEAPAKPAGA